MAEEAKNQIVNALMELADEPYMPELADEDYSAAAATIRPAGNYVDISFEEFKRCVDAAFRKRMKKHLSAANIENCIASEVYLRCLRNKYKELRKDNNNQNVSHARVVKGHVASLMHCLALVFG